MKIPRVLRANSVFIICFAGFVLFMCLSLDIAPPDAVTYTNMHMAKRRILRYATDHNQLPTSFDQLPHIEGFSNSVNDGWGRQIIMRVKDDEITLTSYGRDGKEGGTGEDTDIIGIFRAKQDNSAWSDEFCDWLVYPSSHRQAKQ